MKKLISYLFSFIILFSLLTTTAFATNDETIISETVEYFNDGSFLVTTLVVENSLTRSTSTKTGSKTTVLYNADYEAMVTLKLTGSFTYTGSSATCTNSAATYTIHNSNWKVTTATATKSGNKAMGTFTAKKYFLGMAIQIIDETITITCSNTGVLT